MMRVGDVVESKNSGNPLRCGSGIYNEAIVVSMVPKVVLVSQDTSMKWSNFSPGSDLKVIKKAGFFDFLKCLTRIDGFDDKLNCIKQYTQIG